MEGYGPQVMGKIFFGNHPGAVPFIHGGWGKRDGRFLTPSGLSYLELCKVILSEVHPYVGPGFKKTDTKECGVQVNFKVEKITQCSLGPKTLYSQERGASSPRSPDCPTPGGKAPFNTPVNNVRFSRPLSIYSPVFDRRNFRKSVSCSEDGGYEARDGSVELVDGEKKVLGTEKDPSVNVGNPPHQAFKGSNFQVSFTDTSLQDFWCRRMRVVFAVLHHCQCFL
jgi:hypothetical protein